MHFRYNLRLLLPILMAFFLIAGLMGCKEGTNKTTVGQLIGADGGSLSGLEEEGVTFHAVNGKLSTSATDQSLGNTKISIIQNSKVVGSTNTTDDGSFFMRLPEGFYELKAADESDFFSPTSYFIRVLPGGSISPETIEIAINSKADASQKRFSISGKCVNRSDTREYIPYALVELGRNQGASFQPLQVIQTSLNGDFNFSDLLPDAYTLRIANNSDQYEKREIPFTISSTGQILPPVAIIMISPRESGEQLFAIEGKVVNSNNLMESLANVLVELLSGTDPIKVQQTTSGGDFELTNVKPGNYTIRFTDPTNKFKAKVHSLEISAFGEITPPVNISRLEPEATTGTPMFTISGRAMNRNNTSEPAAYIAVELLLDNNGVTTTLQIQQTSSSGEFSFTNIPAGSYQIGFAKGADFFEERPPAKLEVTNGGVINPPVNMVLIWPKQEIARSHKIQGKAVDKNRTSLAIASAIVELLQNNEIKHVGITTANGDFSFDQVVSGEYNLSIKAAGKYEDYLKSVTIADDGTVTPPINLVFIETTETTPALAYMDISGTLTDSYTGAPIEYASAQLKNYGNVLTDKNGKFHFSEVPKGTHEITFSRDGFESLVATFEIVENSTKTSLITRPSSLSNSLIYIQETNKGSIAGRIFDDNGNPLTDKVARLYVMRLVSQTKNIGTATDPINISETGWKIDSSPIKTTRTSTISNGMNNEGTFKFTHISPSSTNYKYVVYIGEANSQLSTTSVPSSIYPTHFSWDAVTSGGAGHIMSWSSVEVRPTQTTYLSNYELNNP